MKKFKEAFQKAKEHLCSCTINIDFSVAFGESMVATAIGKAFDLLAFLAKQDENLFRFTIVIVALIIAFVFSIILAIFLIAWAIYFMTVPPATKGREKPPDVNPERKKEHLNDAPK